MKNLELEYHQNIAKAYDLLRVVFFNRWMEDTIWELKSKAEVLSSDLRDSTFVKSFEALEGSSLDEARWDYNRLFIGPKKPLASPFESVHRSQKKLMMREFAFEVREFYAQVGLKVENEGRFPDDFIGFELQYLFYVSQLVVELIKNKKIDEAIALILVRKEFWEKHPKQWFCEFCDDISSGSKEKVWKDLALFILKISKKEEEFFESLPHKQYN